MTNRAVDTKLARLLQKRNVWPSYSTCLRKVQEYLVAVDEQGLTISQIKQQIDDGKLDPPQDPK